MFSVKGWSVDASALKPQTQLFGAAEFPSGSKKSKKRKRGGQDAGANANVDSGDVGALWDQHIEGKAPIAKQRKEADKRTDAGRSKEKVSKNQRRRASGEIKTGSNTIDISEKDLRSGREDGSREKGEKEAGTSKEKEDKLHPAQNAQSVRILPVAPQSTKLTPMQSAMRQKLVSARFRHLNETLYTAPSSAAQTLFDQNPEMFEDYHAGFRQQVSVWPENPLDTFLAILRRRGKVRAPNQMRNKGRGGYSHRAPDSENAGGALPRTHGTCLIADLGCGDARLAETLKSSGDTTTFNLKLHSFDLHSPSALVTKADISNLPLPDGSMDVAIFCLALMGTNWISFIEEAYRILHWKGELWVAEIKSRFGRVGRAGKVVSHSVGSKRKLAAAKKAQERKEQERQEDNEQEVLQTEVDGVVTAKEETDVSAFVDVLRRRGFVLKEGDRSIDLGNKMFVRMEFIKAAKPTKGKNVPEPTEEKEPANPKAKLKFLDAGNEDPATDDESKVLKPCLYKIR